MRPILLTVLGALVLVLAAVLVVGRNVELLATSSVPLGADLTTDPSTTRTVAVLEKGARIDVVSCEDLKHYLVPEVRLPDGQTAFVIGGQFELIKRTPSLTSGKPIVFSCP